MSARDVRVDAYIAKAAPFARPILEHVRATVHAGCPAVEETIKWGFPHRRMDHRGEAGRDPQAACRSRGGDDCCGPDSKREARGPVIDRVPLEPGPRRLSLTIDDESP